MIVYTATELRKDMKRALDAAMAAPIRVKRGDDIFELTKIGDIYGMPVMSEKKVERSKGLTYIAPELKAAIEEDDEARARMYYKAFPPDPTYTDVEEAA